MNVMAEAHDMAKRGGYGFLGRFGMIDYKKRLKMSLEMKWRQYRFLKEKGRLK